MKLKISLSRVTPKQIHWKQISIIILFLSLYYNVIIGMIKDWDRNPDYSHGFLIPFIAAYLLWTKKDSLYAAKITTGNAGLFLLIGGLLLGLLGNLGAELFTSRFSMIVVIGGIVYFLYGKNVFGKITLPLGYLFFMIPLPAILFNAIAFPLKLFAAEIATNIIQLINIPIYREGNIIQLVGVTLEVADACSGIRSLMSMIALGTAYAYFSQNSFLKKIILIALTVPITVCANVGRVAGTGILAHKIGPEAAMGFFHEFAGFFMFAVGFSLLLISGTILGKIKHAP